jgi:hypothetical protein
MNIFFQYCYFFEVFSKTFKMDHALLVLFSHANLGVVDVGADAFKFF